MLGSSYIRIRLGCLFLFTLTANLKMHIICSVYWLFVYQYFPGCYFESFLDWRGIVLKAFVPVYWQKPLTTRSFVFWFDVIERVRQCLPIKSLQNRITFSSLNSLKSFSSRYFWIASNFLDLLPDIIVWKIIHKKAGSELSHHIRICGHIFFASVVQNVSNCSI